MKENLQEILDIIQQSEKLDSQQKDNLTKAVKNADKELEITAFKLERTEKVKKTTAILLEETIEELEQKRKAVENQNHELEIEAALERIRSIAMGMKMSDDLMDVSKALLKELNTLGFENIRNTQIDILNDDKRSFLNYEYSDYGVSGVTEVFYDSHPIVEQFVKDVRSAKDALAFSEVTGKALDEWRTHRKLTHHLHDPKLDEATSLYYYCYSIGTGALGVSSFEPISDDKLEILKRFRNVFNLTYRRYRDIAIAEAQAREAQIELGLERVRARAMAMQSSNELSELVDTVFKELTKLDFALSWCIINIIDESSLSNMVWAANPNIDKAPDSYHMKFEDYPFHDAMMKGYKDKETKYIYVIEGLEKKVYDEYLFKETEFRKVPKEAQAASRAMEKYVCSFTFSNFGGLQTVGEKPLSDENLNILSRFGKVFDLTYTRFNDIKQAEAQAREAQIEAALERVRSRSMAMHHTSELQDVINTVHQQFKSLDIAITGGAFIAINEENKNEITCWGAGGTADYVERVQIPYFDRPIYIGLIDGIQKGQGFFTEEFSYEEKIEFFNHLFKHPPYIDASQERKKEVMSRQGGYTRSCAVSKYTNIFIINHHGRKFSEEENNILMRFGKVFEQSYTRFLDLQKAEAQAREAQIELALERVRARTMAMHKSEELAETASVLFEQFLSLEIVPKRCSIGIINRKTNSANFWMTTHAGKVIPGNDIVPLTEEKHLIELYDAWQSNKTIYSFTIHGEDRANWTSYVMDKVKMHLPEYQPNTIDREQILNEPAVFNCFLFSHGFVMLHTVKKLNEKDIPALKRFAGVFEQTYTRFLDLQKAEAQSREAQIEVSLERVRSKAMAMHSPEDLSDTISVFFKELKKLGVTPLRCGVAEIDEKIRSWTLALTNSTEQGDSYEILGDVKQLGHPILDNIFKHWELQKEYYPVLQGPDIKPYYQFLRPQLDVRDYPDEAAHYGNYFYFKEGFVFAWTENKLSEEDLKIFRRFTSVLSLTYRRYMDLKDAEAQAREAQIEVSLERVRSNAMAMHSPEDLSDTVNVFFKELKTLGIIPIRCGVGQVDDATRTTSLTTTTSSTQGDSFEVIGKIKQTGHPILDEIYENWILQKEYHPILKGKDIIKYYGVINAQISYPNYSEDETQYGNYFYFKEGFVFAWTEKELFEEGLTIFRRFTSVLSLTYRRYMDLKEAEVRAFEAVRQASLDRVRAEIASMRTAEDLQSITPIIWRELKTLDVPFIRCGVFIVDEESANVQIFLTTPDGKSLAALNLPFDANKITSNTVEHWRKKQVYKEHWNKEEFINWTNSLIEIGQVQNAETYQGSAKPPESLDLHFLPFAQGMLYVGNTEPLPDEKLLLVKALAEAFSIAYTRYEDFQRLEAAKAEVESAFGELDILSKELKVKNEVLETENERKAIELEEARQLQLSMLPKVIPELPNIDIAVFMKTATEVGGDYYDFQVGMDGTLITVIGDATGHGMKAGTVVTITKSLFNSMAANESILGTFDKISEVLKGMKFRHLAMCLLMIKIRGNRLSMSSAAMPPALIFRTKEKSVEEILLKGMPLGSMNKFPYKKIESHLNSGDRILLYSDGLPELANETGEMYGYDRIKTEFHSVGEKGPEEIVEHLKISVSQWANGKEPDDDVTFVVIKMK